MLISSQHTFGNSGENNMKESRELRAFRYKNRNRIAVLQRNGLFGEWREVNMTFGQAKLLAKVFSKLIAKRTPSGYRIGKVVKENND